MLMRLLLPCPLGMLRRVKTQQKSRDFGKALLGFGNLSHLGIVYCNTMLYDFDGSVDALNFARWYAKEGECDGLEAVLLFVNMIRQGAISAYGHMKNLGLYREANTWFDPEKGILNTCFGCNVLMSTYSKYEVPTDAKAVI
ncbi:Pentatricopeptide repeat-containing protein [Spatholobus suberectus]|nr:Pentatricopeptide repeat-containing protein [Spatholobus suberectus]